MSVDHSRAPRAVVSSTMAAVGAGHDAIACRGQWLCGREVGVGAVIHVLEYVLVIVLAQIPRHVARVAGLDVGAMTPIQIRSALRAVSWWRWGASSW